MRTKDGRRLYALFMALLLPLLSVQAQSGQTVYGVVHDAQTGDPIVGAHLQLLESRNGAVSDDSGRFELDVAEDDHLLRISHIGYRPFRLAIDTESISTEWHLSLEPETDARLRELIILSDRDPDAHTGVYSDLKTRPVEDHLGSLNGVELVSRTQFAADPMVRGLQRGRTEVLIDGMRMTPACVDGMDPLTAYLESDNLASMEVNRGSGSGKAGSSRPGLQFHLEPPPSEAGGSVQLETGYHSASRARWVQPSVAIGREKWSIRASGTWRKADDMVAGGGERMEGSSLQKGNVYLTGEGRLNPDHTVRARYIGDWAGWIGYPALLMDTRKAEAHLAGVEYRWDRPVNGLSHVALNLYGSRVLHAMDDYRRDVENRSVMQGMYMPMDGETRTGGVSLQTRKVVDLAVFDVSSELWSAFAFGDMEMIPLDPDDAPMSLLTLGDVESIHSRHSVDGRYFFGSGWELGGQLTFEWATHRLTSSRSRAVYQATYPELTSMDGSDGSWMSTIRLQKALSSTWTLGSRLSLGTRAADVNERYGYYIFQPLDGFFYVGNPGLQPEISRQAELFALFGDTRSALSGRTALWIHEMDRYITGERTGEVFKQMQNRGLARLVGVETEWSWRWSRPWTLSGQASWIHGEHVSYGTPLPMIPPLKGSLRLQWVDGPWQADVRWRVSMKQSRVADREYDERPADGYQLVDLSLRRMLEKGFCCR
ncbi:MAG: TonB-dependent receptor domain-containing protein [Bacteroidota bacterium]